MEMLLLSNGQLLSLKRHHCADKGTCAKKTESNAVQELVNTDVGTCPSTHLPTYPGMGHQDQVAMSSNPYQTGALA